MVQIHYYCELSEMLMKSVFKRTIQQKEFTFYRAMEGEEVVYLILFDKKGKRESVKLEKNQYGQWRPVHDNTGNVEAHTYFNWAQAISENEILD